jgi:hypothetical protein
VINTKFLALRVGGTDIFAYLYFYNTHAGRALDGRTSSGEVRGGNER